MKVRKLIRVLHRDVGYFLCGIVILYAISGIAVNHIDAWNPSYATDVTETQVEPLTGAGLDELESEVVAKLALDPDEVAGRHRPNPAEFVVFLPHGGEATVDIATGAARIRRITPRPLLFEANVLHLNHLKGVWTYVADAVSLLLLGLAVSGLFMLKGPKGLGGRGKWFVAAGLALPIGFLVYYYATR